MIKLMDYFRKIFKCHSPSIEWPEIKYPEYIEKRINDIPTEANLPPNLYRSYLGLDPIIQVDKDKQILKIHEGKSVIIQFDSILKAETIEQLKENIQNQIKENGFAVVDGRYKIVEFDNPKYLIETK